MTLTLDLPDDIAQSLLQRPAEERNRFATALFAEAFAREQAEKEAFREALAQSVTGKVRPASIVHAELRERYNLPDLSKLSPGEILQREEVALAVLSVTEREWLR